MSRVQFGMAGIDELLLFFSETVSRIVLTLAGRPAERRRILWDFGHSLGMRPWALTAVRLRAATVASIAQWPAIGVTLAR